MPDDGYGIGSGRYAKVVSERLVNKTPIKFSRERFGFSTFKSNCKHKVEIAMADSAQASPNTVRLHTDIILDNVYDNGIAHPTNFAHLATFNQTQMKLIFI
jgi:hypothetical protein